MLPLQAEPRQSRSHSPELRQSARRGSHFTKHNTSYQRHITSPPPHHLPCPHLETDRSTNKSQNHRSPLQAKEIISNMQVYRHLANHRPPTETTSLEWWGSAYQPRQKPSCARENVQLAVLKFHFQTFASSEVAVKLLASTQLPRCHEAHFSAEGIFPSTFCPVPQHHHPNQ